MTYRLTYDPAVEAVHDALPPEAREQLTLALAAAADDPIGATEPYGADDPYMRLLVIPHTTALIFIGHTRRTLAVLNISYLG
ncbi:hypothetical protein ACMA1D_02060 [Streptomyces sp. 796.1]|uniref:hypothetical protein n=1 Tax=Streptomyces sp. 796.1 TaxID=3163029 RepID=UPI0039C9CF14